MDGVLVASLPVTPLVSAPVFNVTMVPSQLYIGQTAQAFVNVSPALEYYDYNGGGGSGLFDDP